MMSENKVEEAPKLKPTARLTVSKEQAMDLKIGTAVRLEVTGEVKEISKCFNDSEEYDIVLEDPNVQKVEDGAKESKDEDKEKNLADLSLGELKKLISKKEED